RPGPGLGLDLPHVERHVHARRQRHLPGTIPLTLTSCNGATGSLVPDVLTSFGLPTCNNGNATSTCPPTQGQILSGWTCVVPVAEFDPVQLTPGAHIGFRVFNMKSPIPAKLCN